MICALIAFQVPLPGASFAAEGAAGVTQAGEGQWVPSFAIVSGVTIQKQTGSADSLLFEDGNPVAVPLRGFVDGSDVPVSPFVGGSIEVMTPAFAIPTRPRLFLSGELLPTFANEHAVAVEGDPGCIRGPAPGAPCVSEITEIPLRSFEEDSVNGEGSRTSAQVDTLVFGANLGVAFPAQLGKRQLRIKPSVGWINYKVDGRGFISDAACDPLDRCIEAQAPPGPGFLRETTLRGSGSQYFNGLGPGLDVEMDVGRYGPLGVSLFGGARAYRILGDRSFDFDASQAFDDQLGNDVATADFEVEVNPWIYRANVGIRFQWLGSLE
jgi:hypothetical protein